MSLVVLAFAQSKPTINKNKNQSLYIYRPNLGQTEWSQIKLKARYVLKKTQHAWIPANSKAAGQWKGSSFKKLKALLNNNNAHLDFSWTIKAY